MSCLSQDLLLQRPDMHKDARVPEAWGGPSKADGHHLPPVQGHEFTKVPSGQLDKKRVQRLCKGAAWGAWDTAVSRTALGPSPGAGSRVGEKKHSSVQPVPCAARVRGSPGHPEQGCGPVCATGEDFSEKGTIQPHTEEQLGILSETRGGAGSRGQQRSCGAGPGGQTGPHRLENGRDPAGPQRRHCEASPGPGSSGSGPAGRIWCRKTENFK